MKKAFRSIALLLTINFIACYTNDNSSTTNTDSTTDPMSDCVLDQVLDDSRGVCDETLVFTNAYNETITGANRVISANSIPDHMVGLFGMGQGSLNPNAISEQNEIYTITTSPVEAVTVTPLLADGPQYSFGVLLNGVELDPIAAEPFPHQSIMEPNVNWEWNLETLNVNLGVDCNNAYVQPTGK